jgi:hypothetical protein
MSQNHFTIRFPLKSPVDSEEFARILAPFLPDMLRAEDAIGTVHYSRFTVLSEKTMLFLGDFDGEFGQLMLELAGRSGPKFDAIFKSVNDPPPTPVANNAEAFVEWTAEHLLHPAFVYTAYSVATAKQIKTLAAAADVQGASQPNIFLVILPSKSRLAFAEMQIILRSMGLLGKVRRDLDKVGTPTSHNSCLWRTGNWAFLRFTTARSTSTLMTSPEALEKSLMFYSNSPRTRPLRRAESTSRSSRFSPRKPAELRSASTRPILA